MDDIKKAIIAIGDMESLVAFNAVGFELFPITNSLDAVSIIHKHANRCAIIYITEEIAKEIATTIAEYETQSLPSIVPIPSVAGSNGFAKELMEKAVIKAIGTKLK